MNAPDLPWEPERMRPVLYGRVIVRLRPGVTPDRLPHALEVAQGKAVPALRVDAGGIDRVVARHSPAARAMRVFAPRAAIEGGKVRWDDDEESTGVARVLALDIDPGAPILPLLEDLAALGAIESASPCYLTVAPFQQTPPGRLPKDPWYGQRMVGAAEALTKEPGDSSLVVAIVDSGIALGHPELGGRLRPGTDVVDLPGDQLSRGLELVGDFRSNDRDPADDMGHGTGCAGIIGANGRRLPKGLAGAARLLPVRVLAAARSLDKKKLTAIGSAADIDRGVKLAIDLGARVLNLSFGTPQRSLRVSDATPHAEVVAYARRRGCVLVAASGNSGRPDRFYPSCLDGVIAVGSVGEDGRPSAFTSTGDHVDLCAPGEKIPTAGLQGYRLQTGTSFAAPFVTGAAALLCAVFARHGEPVDPERIRTVLARTARPFPHGTPVRGCGSGVLDVPAAIAALSRELAAEASS